MGRLLLAHLADAEIRALVALEDLAMPNGETISMDAFIASVGQAKQRGYCITSGLVDAFSDCIAAPILGADGHACATLCFVVPIDTPDHRCKERRDTLVRRGLELSMRPN